MLLTLGQIAHLNICTISDQVARLVSLTQPTEDGEDMQSLVNAASHEQSLTPTTECKQSLATPNEYEQSLANPSRPTPKQSLNHQAIPQQQIRESDSAAGEDSYLAGEADDAESPSPNKGLLLHHIHSTRKRWWLETSYQP